MGYHSLLHNLKALNGQRWPPPDKAPIRSMATCCAAATTSTPKLLLLTRFGRVVLQLLPAVPAGAGQLLGLVLGRRPGAALHPGRAAAALRPGALREDAAVH